MARYRIGIDLGTTNCALAAVATADREGSTFIVELHQQEGAETFRTSQTLPSFLYLPPEGGEWVAGLWARSRMLEVPDRVVSSAKSWLIHHSADRRARFLPLGNELASPLSPVEALARLLFTLRQAWEVRHPDAPFNEQEIAITVPASFDPVAQQLTLEAAALARFPEGVMLLEEPQAAFYAWLEKSRPLNEAAHVLVIDLGGGTTDFSLFALEPGEAGEPKLNRLAVSNHLLLGGDNLDLALAHFIEKRLDRELPPTAFARLLARCREIKEEALSSDDSEQVWPIAVALPGASLLAGTLRCEVTAREIGRLLLEGFFPDANKGERPLTGGSGLREAGLPYAREPAVTRHLSDFLRDRPKVDYVLFNGGLTKAPAIRERVLENLARWQEGQAPKVLDNPEPDLSVARGASRFLHLRSDPARIEAGAAAALYVGVGGGKALCVLPLGAPAETSYHGSHPGLRALVGQEARFALYRNLRRSGDVVGEVVTLNEEFQELPPVETLLALPGLPAGMPPQVRVSLQATLRSTGLLRVELVAADFPKLKPWPLEFSLRQEIVASEEPRREKVEVGGASKLLHRHLTQPRKSWEKLTANAILSELEKLLGQPRAQWSGATVRALAEEWLLLAQERQRSPEHEEAWLHLGAYWLRPGCGMPGDAARLDRFWPALGNPSTFPRKSVRLQRWIAGRRLAPGLNPDRAAALWKQAAADWKEGAVPSAEVALLAGALESLPATERTRLAHRMADAVIQRPEQPALWRGLGRLLARALFHGGHETVVPPEVAVELWEKLRRIDPPEVVRAEAIQTWLRTGRLTGLRPLDLPAASRKQIDDLLKRWKVTEVRRHVLHEVVPIVVAEQAALLGESLPPGLTLDD